MIRLRSRSRLAADWFAMLRENATTGLIEHTDVAAVKDTVTTTVASDIAVLNGQLESVQNEVTTTVNTQLAGLTAQLESVQNEVATTVSSQLAGLETQIQNIPNPIVSGTVAYFAMATAPAGWLKANGAALSRAAYPDLFAALGTTYGAGDGSTTFNIPDLRGEFVRGFDDGRGADSGRGFGSAQASEMAQHQHFTVRNATSNQRSQYGITTYTNNYLAAVGSGGYETYYLNGHTSEANTALTSRTGGAENRPRNIAMLACIKY